MRRSKWPNATIARVRVFQGSLEISYNRVKMILITCLFLSKDSILLKPCLYERRFRRNELVVLKRFFECNFPEILMVEIHI